MTESDLPDPNEAYDIVPIPPGELMHSRGWYTLRVNGIPWMHGPLESMQHLATDPAARAEERKSKKLHDRGPA